MKIEISVVKIGPLVFEILGILGKLLSEQFLGDFKLQYLIIANPSLKSNISENNSETTYSSF